MAFFQKIKEAFVKSNDKDKYLSGLNRSKKSFGDRIRVLSNNFHGIDDELLEEIMVILLESDVGIHTAQKIVDAFEQRGKEIKNYDSMEDYLISILYDFYDEQNDEPIQFNSDGPTIIFMVGVNGSGKTTTSAKLIKNYKEEGKKWQWLQRIHLEPELWIRLKFGPIDWMWPVLKENQIRIQVLSLWMDVNMQWKIRLIY